MALTGGRWDFKEHPQRPSTAAPHQVKQTWDHQSLSQLTVQLTQTSSTSMCVQGDSLGFKVSEQVCFIPWKLKTFYLKTGTNKLLNRWEQFLRY